MNGFGATHSFKGIPSRIIPDAVRNWQMLVPESMTEGYVLRNEEDYGHVTYSNFRRFTVKTSDEIPARPDTR